jgi:hypothetical protein
VSSLFSVLFLHWTEKGGSGKTPHPASSLPLRAPGLAGSVQPGQRLQEQRLQYDNNGVVIFLHHTRVAAAARALCPFLLTRGPASRDPASSRKQDAATHTTTLPSTQRSTTKSSSGVSQPDGRTLCLPTHRTRSAFPLLTCGPHLKQRTKAMSQRLHAPGTRAHEQHNSPRASSE